ncbi:DUF389 domain-containing protein [Synechococcus sp. CCY 9618]|uniref:DUF389 domain-containing protein n=1 Tax=Synechococcus sp. CCY 9618 TaxID=2815602 RepID=UPI0020B2D29C|nr:DUF389 domain-containing protein [Synechococcus sp. CCY 9618]
MTVRSEAMAEELSRDLDQEAGLDQVYLFLTVGAGLIASLGLLANSPAVVIGAMLVAPWIMPLRAAAFGILQGRVALVGRALVTLAAGVAITVLLSWTLGLVVGFPVYGSEVLSRTTPNLLDLAIALVAGAIAIYGKVHSKAVSSLAGTAIAVALVPPVCVFGLLLATRDWSTARGAGLLFAANLLGILSGGLITLAAITPGLRTRLWSSRLGLMSLLLTALLLVPLSGSFLNLVAKAQREVALQQVERAITESLRQRTITLGKDSELMGTSIDWSQNPPLITASVRVSKPNLPTPKQVAAVQNFINRRQPINFRLLVQRMSIDVIGPETAPNPPEATEQLVQPRPPEPSPVDRPPAPTAPIPGTDPTKKMFPDPELLGAPDRKPSAPTDEPARP